jgi:hypothetical protein
MELNQFTGTEQYYKSNMFVPKLVHTDGVEYFCREASAYWFLDIVAWWLMVKPQSLWKMAIAM